MSCRKRIARQQSDIYKTSYDEIIKSAKRKHQDEFFIFKNTISEDTIYSECSVDIYNCCFEHWHKVNRKWIKE